MDFATFAQVQPALYIAFTVQFGLVRNRYADKAQRARIFVAVTLLFFFGEAICLFAIAPDGSIGGGLLPERASGIVVLWATLGQMIFLLWLTGLTFFPHARIWGSKGRKRSGD